MAPSRDILQGPIPAICTEFIEKLHISRPLIHDLPSELIDLIARNLDNLALIACKSASPTLRARVYQEFGRRFFTAIFIGINPFGLRGLREIAKHLDLAKHVQIIRFGWKMTLTDPLHDSQIMHKQFSHTSHMKVLEPDLKQLRDTCTHFNALKIAQALPSFPRLDELCLWRTTINYQSPIRPRFIGGLEIDYFECPSGHCAPWSSLYVTESGVSNCIAKAIEYARLKAGVSLGFHAAYRFNGTTTGMHGPTAPAIASYENAIAKGLAVNQRFDKRPWRLQLCLGTTTVVPVLGSCMGQWQDSNINALDVTFERFEHKRDQQPPFGRELIIRHLPLRNLRHLSFKLLWTRNTTLCHFLRENLVAERITRISLVHCSVRVLRPASSDGNPLEFHWKPVMEALQRLPNLSFLHLDHLESNEDVSTAHSTILRNECLNLSSSKSRMEDP
jgi:hypothetical protein